MFDLAPLPFDNVQREDIIDIFNWTVSIEDDYENDLDVLMYHFMGEPVAYGRWITFDKNQLETLVEEEKLDATEAVEEGELTREQEEALAIEDPNAVVTFLHLQGITTLASQVEDIHVEVPLFTSEVEVLHFLVEFMIGMHGLEDSEDISYMDA